MRTTVFILVTVFLAACADKRKARIENLFQEMRYQDSLKHFDSSLRLSNELLKLNPKDLRGLIHRVKAIAGLGDTASAITELDQIILNHRHEEPYLMKAIFYLGVDTKQSVQLAHEALAINPEYDLAYAILGGIYTSEIVNRDSSLYYVRILEQRKADGLTSLMVLENAYLKYGTPQQLLDITTRIIKKMPEEPYPYNNRGYAEIRLKMFTEARRDILKSLSIDSNNSYAYKNLGLLFIELKQKDSACFHLQTAKTKGFKEIYGNEVDSLVAIYCQ